MKGTAYIDGSCSGNPGDAGYAVILTDEAGHTLETVGRFIGRATNNVAEFMGLLACLEIAARHRLVAVTIHSDSQLLVNQIHGTYKIRQPHLQRIHDRILEAAHSASIRFTLVHIPREENKEADKLARRAVRLKMDIENLTSTGRTGDRSVSKDTERKVRTP
jgi:ribonuclease HI